MTIPSKNRPAAQPLTQFADTAEKLGMPVKFLRRVVGEYRIWLLPGSGTDAADTWWNKLHLYESTWKGLQPPKSKFADETSVQTLYHEATHALMDLDDVDDNGLFKSASYEYARARLTNGNAVDDPDRVTHEAAASYVGHRAAIAWMIFGKMDFWNQVLVKISTREMTPDRGREIMRMTTNGLGIPEYYERAMQDRVFGYQEVGSSQVSVANQPIPTLLKAYCDGAVLENKIFDGFANMIQFEYEYRALRIRLGTLGLPEKP